MTASEGLEVSELRVRRRGRDVLDGVSFQAGKGVLAVLGRNGAGKTSMLRVLVGLSRPSQGRIRFGGRDFAVRHDVRALRASLGYQPQSPAYNQTLTVRESLEYAAWLKGLGRARTTRQVDATLERAALTELSGRQVRRLSGGQQKRTAIAQAMVHEPGLLVLDEPTAALDPTERRSILDLVGSLRGTTTVLLSTHITTDLASADDILVLDGGRARFTGSASRFRSLSAPGAADTWESALSCVCAE